MASHAYYPLGVEIPNYVPNQWSPLLLCSIFAVACTVALTIARMIATNLNPGITAFELSKVFWFSICSPIHLILEGYYAFNFATIASSHHLLAQLWKEYSLSDSRYLTSDAFVMCMESVTAWCWGPLSLLLAYFIITNNSFRHPLQIIISTGQLYGDVLYLGTVAFDYYVYGIDYSRPESYYFYGYFTFLNGIWLVVPTLLIAESVRACARSFEDVEKFKKVGMAVNEKKTL